MLRTGLTVLLAAMLSIIAVPMQYAAAPKQVLERVKRDFDDGKYENASKLLTESLSVDGHHIGAHRCRAFCWLLLGKPELATLDFSTAMRNAPEDATLYYGRGSARYLLGKLDLAKEDFDEAIRLDPAYAAAYFGRMKVAFDAGNHVQGRKDNRILRELASRNDITCDESAACSDVVSGRRFDLFTCKEYLFWVSLFASRRSLEVRDIMLKPLKVTPLKAAELRQSAVVCATSQQIDRAFLLLEEAITLDPSDANVRQLRGILYATQREWKKALVDFTNAIELAPDDPNLYAFRGNVYLHLGECRKGVADHDAVLRISRKRLPGRRDGEP